MKKVTKNKKFTYELHKGNVRDTLKSNYVDEPLHLAFIGSGNSEQTVRHEYDRLKNVPIVIMDHFFTKERGDEETP